MWRADCRELFYSNSSVMMAVAIDTRKGFTAGTSVRLFDASAYRSTFGRDYDVSPDVLRFLMVKDVETGGTSPTTVVVQNWHEELKHLAPAN